MPPQERQAKYQTLIKLAPFRGLDTSTSDPEQDDLDAKSAPNADPFRDKGALCTAKGRVNVGNLAAPGITGSILLIAPANLTSTVRVVYAVTSANGVLAWHPDTNFTNGVLNAITFTDYFQYGTALFTNQGQQFRAEPPYTSSAVLAYAWQYSWLTYWSNGNVPSQHYPVWTLAAGAGTNLSAQTYYYAFTLLTEFPDGSTQESSPNPTAFSPFSLSYTLGSAGAIAITPGIVGHNAPWSATNPDGSTYTTNIYRMSTAQPTFLFVANMTGSSTTTYNDDAADSTIASNAQLDLYRDPPPTCASALNPNDPTGGVVFTYKERAWCFVMRQDALTNNQPQCQLWYSDYGLPYSFNAAYQVLLVGNEDSALNPAYGPGTYGDSPAAAVTLSSCTLMWKRKKLFVLWGDDETTFIVREIGSWQIMAPESAADCDGVAVWLDVMGVHSCDGFARPEYIGEDIRLALAAIPFADRQNAVGWYDNRSYYLSFPATGITYVYYFLTKKWRQLAFGTSSAFAVPSDVPPTPSGLTSPEVLAVRPGTLYIDAWTAAETDLGNQMVAQWTSPLQDAGDAFARKNYRYVGISNPLNAPGCTASVTLTVYSMNNPTPFVTTYPATGTIDLSQSVWTAFPIPQGEQKGYLAQVTVTLTNAPNATTYAEIYNVIVSGTLDQEWAIPV